MTRRFFSLPILPLMLAVTLAPFGCATRDDCRPRHRGDLRLEPFQRGDLKYPNGVRGVRGSVSLHVRVERSGSVSRVVPIASQPPGLFEAAAIEYVSNWRYCPRTSKDRDFPSPMLVEIEFIPAK